jgi:uncharacterized protein (DUF4415 family)
MKKSKRTTAASPRHDRDGWLAQKAPTKVPMPIRLSRDVLGYFKRKGKGWQTRIDDALGKVAGLKR